VATGTDHHPQKKKKRKSKRGDFREEVKAARSARGVLGSLVPARDSSLKRTASGRTTPPQTLYVSLLTPTPESHASDTLAFAQCSSRTQTPQTMQCVS
jgi:hypothetical protein